MAIEDSGGKPLDINPLTVAKVYKELAREGLMIKKGVRDALLKRERTKFIKEEWPALKERMQRLGIDIKSLVEEE